MSTTVTNLIGDFKPGSIRRIRLKNFLTYTNVEFKPGPRLNIVCGPNGSGKSTLLCAICLGLGGEPKTLGRSDDVRRFITHDKDMAEIEIELEPVPNQVDADVIRRVIDGSKGSKHGHGRGASTYFINGKEVSAKRVHELVTETYAILVDNLCTFLPQERVGNFSALTPRLLLEETEKVLSEDQKLYREHQRLIEMETEIHHGNSDVVMLQARLKQLEEENERLEREKKRMEERERALEQAKLYRMKLLWLRFDDAHETATLLKEQRAQLVKKLKLSKQRMTPLENNCSLICLHRKLASDRLQVEEKNCDKLEKTAGKQLETYERLDETVDDLLVQEKHLRGIRERRRQDLEIAQERLSKLESTRQAFPPRKAVIATYEDAARTKRSVGSLINNSKRKLLSQHQQLRDAEESVHQSHKKLCRLNDDKARRNDGIFRSEPKLKQVYEWLQLNRSRFRRQVWGPVVCEITTKSQVAATFIEQHVPNTILKAFVVECREDLDLLYKLVRQDLGIAINIQIITDGKLGVTRRLFSESKMELLKREHGIAGYLDQTFAAPDAIMAALRTWASVHDVLVGNAVTQRSIDQTKLIEFVTEPDPALGQTKPLNPCIFTSEGSKFYKYTANISRYSQKAVVRVDEVKAAKWLVQGVDPIEKAAAEDECRQAQEKVVHIRQAIAEAEAKLANDQKLADTALNLFNEAKVQRDSLEKLLVRIANARAKARAAEAAIENAQDDAEKKQISLSLKIHVGNLIFALESHAELHRQLRQATLCAAAIKIKKQALLVSERQAREKIDEAKRELDKLERQCSEVASKFVKARDQVQQLKRDAEKEAPLVDRNGRELPLKRILSELEVTTKEEAEAALEEVMAKASSIDDNPDVVRQYEQRKEEIETLQQKLHQLQSSRNRTAGELQEQFATWEKQLTECFSQASVLFTKYMAELGCAGEVVVNKGAVEGDAERGRRRCKDWGVEIRVKFREKSTLQVLSAHVHSGGERSVSTIIYLMALQELMVCPFRCVDEINQGLDERNEHLVFKRIVANSTGKPKTSRIDHSGQYFLVTPKLLPNLTDMEHEAVTILTIFSGDSNFENPSDWDVDHFKELRMNRGSLKPGSLPIKSPPATFKHNPIAMKQSPVAVMNHPFGMKHSIGEDEIETDDEGGDDEVAGT